MNTPTNTSNVTSLTSTSKPQTSVRSFKPMSNCLSSSLRQDTPKRSPTISWQWEVSQLLLGNILEIARQKPDATRVAGLYAWNQLGRRVKKGERGIRILAPMIGTRRRKDTEKTDDPTITHKPVLVGFSSATVFDVSQTEGAPLPEFTKRTKGEVGQYRERLIDLIIAQEIELDFKDSVAPALGMSYGDASSFCPDNHHPKSSARLYTNWRTRCCTRWSAVRPQPNRTRDRSRGDRLCGVADNRP